MTDADFRRMLREDMLQTRQRRFQCQLAKITAVGSFIGAGALLHERLDTTLLFYVIPFIAIVFDLFLLGQSFTMRRMHRFVRSKSISSSLEKSWEDYVAKCPNKYSTLGNLGVTALCILGCGGILWEQTGAQFALRENVTLLLWLLALVFLVGIIYRRQRKILQLPEPNKSRHTGRLEDTEKAEQADSVGPR